MADDDKVRLSPEQIAKAKSWFDAKTGDKIVCVACGENEWAPAPHLVQPVTVNSRLTIQLAGAAYPQFMLVCTKCAHTLFFNAVAMGLVPARQHSDDDAPDSRKPSGGKK